MKNILLLAALLLSSLQAQIQNVSTDTDDGSVIHFTTFSRLRGTTSSPLYKVYRLDGKGFRALDEGSLDYYVLHSSSSRDGKVVALNLWDLPCLAPTAPRNCLGPASFLRKYEQSIIEVNGKQLKFGAHAQIASAGSYALLYFRTGDIAIKATQLPSNYNTISRFDFAANREEQLLRCTAPAPFASYDLGGRWINDTGSIIALCEKSKDLTLIEPSGKRTNFGPLNDITVPWVELANNATFFLYETRNEIHRRNSNGADILLEPVGSRPVLTADSKKMLFLSPVKGVPQAFLRDLSGPTSRQITDEPAGVAEATISRIGSQVIVSTLDCSLISIDLNNGNRAQFIDHMPKVDIPLMNTTYQAYIQAPQVPGSTYQVKGQNLSYPSIDKTEVTVAGFTVKPTGEGNGYFYYQTPWSLPVFDSMLRYPNYEEVIIRSGDPQWEAVIPFAGRLEVAPYPMELGRLPSGEKIVAVHGDWRGYVTKADAARELEVIHLSYSGLGPVQPFVETGVTAPANPVAITTKTCDWERSGFKVLYSGLAPGLVGIYQLTLQMPRVITRTFVLVSCSLDYVPYGTNLNTTANIAVRLF